MLKKLDHIGIAVRDIDAALVAYVKGLGMTLAHREHVPTEAADVAFLPLGETRLELLQPRGDGVLARFLEKRGPGIHHLCFEVDDIRAALARLEAAGVSLVDREPRPGAEGCLVAFVHPRSTGGVLVELSQRPRDVAAARDELQGVEEIGRGSLVVVSMHSPREKVWGQVIQMNALGLTVRGIDLSSFEDWVTEVAGARDEMTMGLATLFLPMHRLERVELDATVGAAKSCAAFFEERTRMNVREYLRTKLP